MTTVIALAVIFVTVATVMGRDAAMTLFAILVVMGFVILVLCEWSRRDC